MLGFSLDNKDSKSVNSAFKGSRGMKNSSQKIISSHESGDFSKSSTSKILLNDLNSYIGSISQEYAANFSIIHSNLLEFKVMVETLFRSCNSGFKEMIQTLPKQSSEKLINNKRESEKIFVKIFKFLDKFLHTLSDFSSEPQNFDKFSDIPDNTSSFHNIYEDDFESELISSKQENKLLKEQLSSSQKKVKKVSEYCESLLLELETHKNTSSKLKTILEKLRTSKGPKSDFEENGKKIDLKKISSIFESHLTKLSRKVTEREKKIDELENKYEDFEDLKAYNQNLYRELQSLTIEYEKFKSAHKNSSKTQDKKIDKAVQVAENPIDPPSIPVKSIQESKIQRLTSSKTMTSAFKISEPSELDKSKLEIKNLQQEIENYKEIIKNLSSELDDTEPEQFLDKIKEVKIQRDSNYCEAQEVSEILNELQEYTGLPSGKLLAYIQNNEKLCKMSCLNIFMSFDKMMKSVSNELNRKICELDDKIGRLNVNFKKIWLE